ncbi:MAG: YbaB/EbfC family nucleoid-associated protein [Holosporaceae bacterium]|jgi:DNA-binding YbaB/EbfC family protein|nr:YbaB/EbfC family nucleoid-associated protein [Holosporaceae bacterium]
MNNFNQLMKQAQEMQAKFLEAQSKLNEMEVAGTSGGGMVTVILNGKIEMKKLSIDHTLLSPSESEILSDLIIAAFNDARAKITNEMSTRMGGLLPPGMQMPF